jgi:hypothetical protein
MSKYETEVKAVGLSFRHVKEKLRPNDKVKLLPEPDNKYDPNALAIHTLDGAMLGYVGKKDKLRTKMLKKAQEEEVQLPVIVANYYKEGDEKLWESVEEGDLVQLWLRAYGTTPVDDDSFEKLTSFTGEEVLWSEYLHVCTDLKGNELMGGSTYASLNQKDFDTDRIAKAWAKKNGFKVEEVLSYWKDLSQISKDYGTAVHKGMELYNKHHKMVGHEVALPRVPHLREAVKQFLKASDFDNCIAEPLITDVEMGMSGWIDNLRFIDKKTVIIEDFKTNTFKDQQAYFSKWESSLKTYKRQMDYYGTILENFGYKVAGTVIWHWHEGRWDKHTLNFTPVAEYRKLNKEA